MRPESHDAGAPRDAAAASLANPDSTFEAGLLEKALARGHGDEGRWMGWRLRLLVLAALLGCLGVFLLIRTLAGSLHLDATWRANAGGKMELSASGDATLRPYLGRVLLAIEAPGTPPLGVDARLLLPSPRWIANDAERALNLWRAEGIAQALQQREVLLHFEGVGPVPVRCGPRGYTGLGAQFWMLSALALVLYLTGAVVLLSRPNRTNGLYALLALTQSVNLLLIATESIQGLGLPPGFTQLDERLRIVFDVITGAAAVHAVALHSYALPGRHWIGGFAWGLSGLFLAGVVMAPPPQLWWWTQGVLMLLAASGLAALTWSHRLSPHPFALMLRRLGLAIGGTLALLTLAIAVAGTEPGVQQLIVSVGSVIWYVFFASVLLLVPFLSRSQQVMREFAMLAGISTVATSLDLLFVAVFALGQFASITLSLFLSLGLYAGARQWIVNQMMGSNMLTAERMFESLYRIAREVESTPGKTAEQLARLLRELFEPLEVTRLARPVSRPRVVGDGATLVVPVPQLPGAGDAPPSAQAIVLRFAHRGRRIFTDDDVRLTERVLEQLVRAVAYDRAVEQGRSEERTRIAQDLHDDIGARLLTLMYKAQTPELEEYIRHTLQDLKTLTRGLAASSHKLSHASAEWKADIGQRLSATGCALNWAFAMDRDVNLSVVQWSALTRMLRELVNNIIAHAHATHVDVTGHYERGRLTLVVTDDGEGRAPETWSHGLGLGGVRKRVKQLGGEVRWRENGARGIACEIKVPELGERR